MNVEPRGAAVIGDVVGSRWKHKTDWHASLVAALQRVNEQVVAVQALAPTVGDEFQGLYASSGAALKATMLVRLELDNELDCRFGVGFGDYAQVGKGAIAIQAGRAWWSARDAIVIAKELETLRQPTVRTWYKHEPDPEVASAQPDEATTNAYLLARDHLLTHMESRTRRLLLGLIQGKTQVELAGGENIGQSAVSRNLRRNGAYAVLKGMQLMESAH